MSHMYPPKPNFAILKKKIHETFPYGIKPPKIRNMAIKKFMLPYSREKIPFVSQFLQKMANFIKQVSKLSQKIPNFGTR